MLNYQIEGAPNSPVLVLSNSLGSDMRMWDELVPLLLPYFRVLRYDTRGHGGSIAAGKMPFDLEQLGRDVLDLLNSLQIDTFHFCGLSMGGLIGQWLGINAGGRIQKLVVCNTAAKIGTEESWNTRIETITQQGLEAIVDATLERWFTNDFREKYPEKVARTRTMFLDSDVEGYANCCRAIRDADFRDKLSDINVPTLVITGNEDPVTNVEQAKYLASHIPMATLTVLNARHLSGTECPKPFSEALINFFINDSTYDRGLHIRRTVLGNAYVDKALHNANDFNGDFQQLITKYAWGEIWSRPGLGKRERSLITIAMLIAVNRMPEFQMHVRAALNNGVTIDEIKEVIMQSAVYCGVPAANEAFHSALEILQSWQS